MNETAAPVGETSRDRHLFGPGPKRLLALDGGGVRGALTVAFLERIETLLKERTATTSVWAIISTWLAAPRPAQ